MERRIVFELTRSFFGIPLSPEASEALPMGVDWARAVQVARAHGVGSICHEALVRLQHGTPGLPEARRSFLRERHFNAYRNQRALRDLADILDLLRGRGIHPVVLKGPSLALALYGDPALRPFADLDLLVDVGDIPGACQALSTMGYSERGEILTGWEAENLVSHLRILQAKDRVPVEVHFRLFPRAMPLFPDEEGVRDRAIWGEFQGWKFLRLAPADELLYLCGHIVRHDSDAHRLLWFCDLALLEGTLGDAEKMAFETSLARAAHREALLGALRTARAWFIKGAGDGAYDLEAVMDSPMTLGERLIPEAVTRMKLLMARMPTWGVRLRFVTSYCFPRLDYLREYHGAEKGWQALLWRVRRPLWALFRLLRSALVHWCRPARRPARNARPGQGPGPTSRPPR